VRRTDLFSLPDPGPETFRIKWAETRAELKQAFSLVHEEYVRMGYIREPNPARLHFSIHNLLPNASTLVMQKGGETVSTLSRIVDDPCFALSMDSLYHEELNVLRDEGRTICEVCALATSRSHQHSNLFMFLFRTMFVDSVNNGMDDICIMVNPKHAAFYKTILLLEELGGVKFYPRVGAPAVALRLDLREYEERVRYAYLGFEPRYDLHRFFYGNDPEEVPVPLLENEGRRRMDRDSITSLLEQERTCLMSLSAHQKNYFFACYT